MARLHHMVPSRLLAHSSCLVLSAFVARSARLALLPVMARSYHMALSRQVARSLHLVLSRILARSGMAELSGVEARSYGLALSFDFGSPKGKWRSLTLWLEGPVRHLYLVRVPELTDDVRLRRVRVEVCAVGHGMPVREEQFHGPPLRTRVNVGIRQFA